jgi:Domain of unknown function (DUF4276)
MREIRYTLLCDGTSDKALIPIISWLIRDLLPDVSVQSQYADFGLLRKPPPLSALDQRMEKAVSLYPCDILFVHRDAEKDSFESRKNEILKFFQKINTTFSEKFVPVVPVRMMETWLLIDEDAIKKAAGNRNYAPKIDLPKSKNLESISEPKDYLHDLLKKVSGLKGRRLENLKVSQTVHIIADSIEDYSQLRELQAFKQLENDVKKVLKELDFKVE